MLLVVALFLLVQVPGRASAACRRLNETDNAIVAFLARASNNKSSYPASVVTPEVRQQFRIINSRLPWFSQCLASVDYWDLLATLTKNDKALQCWRTIFRSTPPPELNDAYFSEFYCPLYVETAIPCVNEVLLPAIQAALASTSQANCCEPMKQQLSEMLGLDWSSFVDQALRHFGNVVCSQKSFFKISLDRIVTQSCGYALSTSFLSDNILDTILTALQISNAQGCRAMSGSRFYTNQGMTAQFFADDGEEPLGICFAPIDTLLQLISRLPVVKSMILRSTNTQLAMYFSSLLGAGRCLRGSLLTGWLQSESDFVMVTAGLIDIANEMVDSFGATQEWRQASSALNITSSGSGGGLEDPASLAQAIRRALVKLDTRLRPLCFHLPNSFPCSYNGGTLTLPFPQASAGAFSQSLVANTTRAASSIAVAGTLVNRGLGLGLLVAVLSLA